MSCLTSKRLQFFKLHSRSSSIFKEVPMGPPDPILGVTEAYLKSTNPNKINVGVGAYRCNQGKPFVLSCVKKAEARIFVKDLNHEYAPIIGTPEFRKAAASLTFGKNSDVIINGWNASVQALSGTGALRIGLNFVHTFFPNKTVYLSLPTWGNHIPVAKNAGLNVKRYKYYNPKTLGFDFEGCMNDLEKMEEESTILLHACAQNPTGIDPSQEQWKQMSQIIKKRKVFPFFDMAYQGFASGDVDKDAFAIRYFIQDGQPIAVAQSFAKNMGLYGERIGALHIVSLSKDDNERILSQLKMLIRPIYSSPPIHGARIVTEILNDIDLKTLWHHEVKIMANRVINTRQSLRDHLKKLNSPKNWDHITNQIGMFCYTGLNEMQVQRLQREFAVFCTSDGRISIPGLNTSNVEYMAKAIHEITKHSEIGKA